MAKIAPIGRRLAEGGLWRGSATLIMIWTGLGGCGGESPGVGGQGGTDAAVVTSTFCEPLLERMDSFAVAFSSGPPRFEGADAEPRSATGRYGGTVVVGNTVELPRGMNSLTSDDYGDGQHQRFLTHMTLVRLDEAYRPEPYLARSWEVAEDGGSVTFHLRDDVYWHDGVRTTAFDVAFTYRMATDPEGAFPYAGFWSDYVPGDAGITVVDSFTVRVAMVPQQEFLDPWRATAIMPRHLLEGVPWESMVTHPYGTQCPVGNGPFRFVEHRLGDRWVLDANPAFPEGLGGRPYLDRYIYRIIPDETTILTELANGSLDLDILVPADRLDEVVANPRIEPIVFPFRSYTFLGWNTRRPQFADARVRRALTMALDREGILAAAAGGHGTVINAPVPPFHPGYDPAASAALPYDPDRAAALLDESGWKDRDGDGLRENEDGVPFTFSILVNDNRERLDLAELSSLGFSELGLDASVEVIEWSTLGGRITSPDRDFDAFIVVWVPEFRLDDRDQFHSDRANGPVAFAGLADADLDDLMDALATEMDPEVATELIRAYQARMVELQPYTFFYSPDRIAARSSRLRGVVMDARGEWATAARWWIDPPGQGDGGG